MMYVQVHELSNTELRAPLSNNNGIRLLEDFQIVFKLKRLWIFFLHCDSLWVAWLRNNILKRREYARIFSTTVSSPEALLVSLYRLIRDRLLYILSIPVTPSSTRSLLQFYFSCFLSFCLKGWCRFSICCNKLLLHHCKIFKNSINFNILPRKKEHHY
ncbi:unnamed protein product [Brassica rapa]|uniref:Uncharacterized protein n=1 Tax=Brassica campestris TaxID=3711 RepID=A0A3P5ZWJ8_BRACM|nr:unnamed protein product [Brassica rapa]VDC76861.1 unnamed protein product [Brassica rapa]